MERFSYGCAWLYNNLPAASKIWTCILKVVKPPLTTSNSPAFGEMYLIKSFVITLFETLVTTPARSAVKRPRPCVAATREVFPGRYLTMYTGTLARPLLFAIH